MSTGAAEKSVKMIEIIHPLQTPNLYHFLNLKMIKTLFLKLKIWMVDKQDCPLLNVQEAFVWERKVRLLTCKKLSLH